MNLDETYCVSPGCKNACGRRPPYHMMARLCADVSMGYFCDIDGNLLDEESSRNCSLGGRQSAGDQQEVTDVSTSGAS